MIQALEMIAAFTAVLFAGAALYINVVEHPARMALETKSAAIQWARSYKRATLLQAPLALASLVTGSAAWLLGRGVWWLVAALLVGAVVPFTFIVVMPTNHKLLAPDRDLTALLLRLDRGARGGTADLARFECVDFRPQAGETALQVAERVGAHAQLRAQPRLDFGREEIAERAGARQLHVAVAVLFAPGDELRAVLGVDALRHRDDAPARRHRRK